MRIGIIGAGHIGGNLAQLLVQHGHQVSIANSRGPETLTEVAARTGATPVTAAEAPRDADVVIMAFPTKAFLDFPEGVLDSAKPGAAVIDTNNYYPQRDGRIGPLDDGETSARWIREIVGRPTVKVFNNIVAKQLRRPAGAAGDRRRRDDQGGGPDAGRRDRLRRAGHRRPGRVLALPAGHAGVRP
jgi:8-hydroxy-5-deazaflavin:NADPH oxidoreductase